MEKDLQKKYIYRIDPSIGQKGARTCGWQVRFDRKTNYKSKLFSDNKYGGQDQALEAAIAWRDEELKSRKESLLEGPDKAPFVLSALPSNNTSGILGVNRSISTERNGAQFPYWQTSFKLPDGKTRVRGFRINTYGEIGALRLAVETRKNGIYELFANAETPDMAEGYARLIDQYEKISAYLDSLGEEESGALIEYLSSLEVSPTSKKEMLERRIAQHIFRNKILDLWGGQCAICGASAFVVASHIKPWSVCTDQERLDQYNGIALSPNYDKAFDQGFITFDPDGRMVATEGFDEQAKLLGLAIGSNLPKYTPFHDKYMNYHRKNIFRGKASNKCSQRSAQSAPAAG